MPDATPTPAFQPVIDGNDASSAILAAFGHALVDWWYVWVLMLVVGVALTFVSAKADRFAERRAKRRR